MVYKIESFNDVCVGIEAPRSKLRGIFSVEDDFILSSLANPAASCEERAR